jgi:hypothetical protein
MRLPDPDFYLKKKKSIGEESICFFFLPHDYECSGKFCTINQNKFSTLKNWLKQEGISSWKAKLDNYSLLLSRLWK